jgi:hypothetical protein
MILCGTAALILAIVVYSQIQEYQTTDRFYFRGKVGAKQANVFESLHLTSINMGQPSSEETMRMDLTGSTFDVPVQFVPATSSSTSSSWSANASVSARAGVAFSDVTVSSLLSSGSVSMTSSLEAGAVTVNGAVSVQTGATFSRAVTSGRDLSVQGSVFFLGTFNTNVTCEYAGNVRITGNSYLYGPTAFRNLIVSEQILFSAPLIVGSNVSVLHDSDVSVTTMTVHGSTVVREDMHVSLQETASFCLSAWASSPCVVNISSVGMIIGVPLSVTASIVTIPDLTAFQNVSVRSLNAMSQSTSTVNGTVVISRDAYFAFAAFMQSVTVVGSLSVRTNMTVELAADIGQTLAVDSSLIVSGLTTVANATSKWLVLNGVSNVSADITSHTVSSLPAASMSVVTATVSGLLSSTNVTVAASTTTANLIADSLFIGQNSTLVNLEVSGNFTVTGTLNISTSSSLAGRLFADNMAAKSALVAGNVLLTSHLVSPTISAHGIMLLAPTPAWSTVRSAAIYGSLSATNATSSGTTTVDVEQISFSADSSIMSAVQNLTCLYSDQLQLEFQTLRAASFTGADGVFNVTTAFASALEVQGASTVGNMIFESTLLSSGPHSYAPQLLLGNANTSVSGNAEFTIAAFGNMSAQSSIASNDMYVGTTMAVSLDTTFAYVDSPAAVMESLSLVDATLSSGNLSSVTITVDLQSTRSIESQPSVLVEGSLLSTAAETWRLENAGSMFVRSNAEVPNLVVLSDVQFMADLVLTGGSVLNVDAFRRSVFVGPVVGGSFSSPLTVMESNVTFTGTVTVTAVTSINSPLTITTSATLSASASLFIRGSSGSFVLNRALQTSTMLIASNAALTVSSPTTLNDNVYISGTAQFYGSFTVTTCTVSAAVTIAGTSAFTTLNMRGSMVSDSTSVSTGTLTLTADNSMTQGLAVGSTLSTYGVSTFDTIHNQFQTCADWTKFKSTVTFMGSTIPNFSSVPLYTRDATWNRLIIRDPTQYQGWSSSMRATVFKCLRVTDSGGSDYCAVVVDTGSIW